MPVSDETKDFLGDVKKGKSRKFVMLVKGAAITSLIAFKKGNATKFVKEAKEDGKGIPCFGLITGKGMDVSFQLAIDDGFDKPPVKDLVLKKFLEEEADFKCKPTIEIVQSRGIALDPDDPLHARFLTMQPEALKGCDAHPDRAGAITDLCKQIGTLLDDDQRDAATKQLDALAKLLGELAQGNEKAGDENSGGETANDDATAAKLQGTLDKLVPQVKQVVTAQPLLKEKLLTPMVEIKRQLEQREFDAAKQGLLNLGKLLKEALSPNGTGDPQSAPADLKAEYERKFKELEPQYLLALGGRSEEANKFRAVMTYAGEQAEAGVFGNAIKALDRLRTAIDNSLDGSQNSSGQTGFSVMQLGKARLELQAAQASALRQIELVRAAVEEEFADDETQRTALVDALKRLDAVLEKLNTDLPDQLDRILNAEAKQRESLIGAFRQSLDGFFDRIDSDPVVAALDGNELLPETAAIGPLKEKLHEIATALG